MQHATLAHRLLSLTCSVALIVIAARTFVGRPSADALSALLGGISLLVFSMYFAHLVVANDCEALGLERASPLRLQVLLGFSIAGLVLGIGMAALSFYY
jgi:hypothetical protein